MVRDSLEQRFWGICGYISIYYQAVRTSRVLGDTHTHTLSLSLSLLLQGMRGVRNPSAAGAPPLFDGALEECEKAGFFFPWFEV